MASPLLTALAAWMAVGPGNLAYLDLPLDRDYETLNIRATADGRTDAVQVVSLVKVIVNGVAIRELTVPEIRRLNAKYGPQYNSPDPLHITLNFREDWLWNHLGADGLLLFTYGLMNVRIEMQIVPGAVNPVLGGYAIAKVQRAVPRETIAMRKTKVDMLDFAGAGTKIFRNVAPVGMVKAFDLFTQNNAVTQVKLRLSGTEVFGLTKAQVDDCMAQNEQSPAAGSFTMPFDLDLTYDAGLNADAIRETELEVTVNAPATIRLIQQYYQPV